MNLNRDPRFKQGIFTPRNPKKFIGTRAIYRSSFELRFMQWADHNDNVLEWGSENIVIPYISPVDGRVHRYYVDNFVVIREGNTIKRYIVEIKPYAQTQPPKTSTRKKKATIIYEQSQWLVNQAKWTAAEKYAREKSAKFIILTERELFAR